MRLSETRPSPQVSAPRIVVDHALTGTRPTALVHELRTVPIGQWAPSDKRGRFSVGYEAGNGERVRDRTAMIMGIPTSA
jgi:hypothetical protein